MNQRFWWGFLFLDNYRYLFEPLWCVELCSRGVLILSFNRLQTFNSKQAHNLEWFLVIISESINVSAFEVDAWWTGLTLFYLKRNIFVNKLAFLWINTYSLEAQNNLTSCWMCLSSVLYSLLKSKNKCASIIIIIQCKNPIKLLYLIQILPTTSSSQISVHQMIPSKSAHAIINAWTCGRCEQSSRILEGSIIMSRDQLWMLTYRILGLWFHDELQGSSQIISKFQLPWE